MNKKVIIDIDAIFDDVVFDEAQIRKDTGYFKSSISHKGKKLSAETVTKIADRNIQNRKNNPYTEQQKYARGNNMRGKTLEEIVGMERAAEGRKKRAETHLGKKRPKEVGEKIAAVRRANGSYDQNGMTGKEHKESTKATMAIKAKVRQELKRELGLGRDGKIPKELLEARYKQLGI